MSTQQSHRPEQTGPGGATSPSTPRRSWIDVQKKTFSGWANNFLKERIMRIKDFDQDLRDGVNLLNLLEIISGKKLPKYNHAPKTRFQKIENISIGIKFIQSQGVKLVSIGAEDITDGSVKLTLGLLWTLILRYQIATIDADGYESPKAALLAWVRKRLAPYRVPVHDFDSSWQDGRALAALTDSMQVGILPLATLSNDPFTDANRAMDLAEEHFGIPKILDAYDLVTIPDDLSIMTYLSYFRDYVVNAEKKADEERLKLEAVRKRTADVINVFARGNGVEREGLYANQLAQFDIQACNFYGEELKSGGEHFAVKISGEEGNEVDAPVTDKGDGSYEVRYLPTVPDNYSIAVTLNGLHIQDSPFHVFIDGASTENTSASGPGITQGGSHVNKPAEFTITARDSKGNQLDHGGDVFKVAIINATSGETQPATIDDNEDGTYAVYYQPTSSGPHNVEVLLRDQPIAGAPYPIVVYAATPENSFAEGSGINDGRAVRPATFTITGVDIDGNKQTSGGEPFKVELQEKLAEGQEEGQEVAISVQGVVKDNNDGTYSVQYTPPEPGDYSLVASLYGVTISGFPKDVYFKPSADGTKSEVTGSGIRNGVAEKPVSISIVAKDKDGAPRTDGGDGFRVVFEVEDKHTDATVVDNGNGTYTAEFTPTAPGDYKVHVLLDTGDAVASSPYKVYIKPLPCAKNTYASGKGITTPFDNTPAVFTIHAVDDKGNPIKEGGDAFDVTFSTPSGDPLPSPPSIVDNLDGTYSVTYRPDQPGHYNADVRVGGNSIKEFPRKVHVREGTEGTVSTFASFSFTVVAHDKRNKAKTFGGDPFEVTITGPREAREIRAVDNGDGTYTASYVLGGNGRYAVKVVLNEKEVEGSPFIQKVGAGKHEKSSLHSASARTNHE